MKTKTRNNGLLKQKKGQFYLFTAIILVGVAVIILRPGTVVPEASQTFKEVHSNFETESVALMNSALMNDEDLVEEYDEFIEKFKIFAKGKNVDFEVFYLLTTEEEYIISNKLGIDVEVLDVDQTLEPEETVRLRKSENSFESISFRLLDDDIDSNIYKFDILDTDNQLKLLSRMEKEGNNEIFIKA